MNLESFTKAVKEKVGDRDIIKTAEEIPISCFELHNAVRGDISKVEDYLILCKWLGMRPGFFLDQEAGEPAPVTMADGLERIAKMELELAELRHSLIKANLEAQPEGGKVRQALDIVVEMLYFKQWHRSEGKFADLLDLLAPELYQMWQRDGVQKVYETLNGPEPEDCEVES